MSEQNVIAVLQESLTRIERGVERQFIDLRQDFRDKHSDNIGRFDRQDERLEIIEADQREIKGDVKRINGSVGKHETMLDRHASQIRWLFTRAKKPSPTTQEMSIEQQKLTVKDALQMLAIATGLIGGSITATYFILKDLLHWGPTP